MARAVDKDVGRHKSFICQPCQNRASCTNSSWLAAAEAAGQDTISDKPREEDQKIREEEEEETPIFSA
jgi:hypothetical protein